MYIKYAYQETNLSLFNVREHDTRILSTSWALFNGANLSEILKTAHWMAENTFTSFYMNDVPRDKLRFELS